MKTSDRGVELVKSHEGLSLKAYLCPAGVWTIGYGHTRTAKKGMEITPKKALDLLLEDLQVAENAVSSMVDVPLTQGQFDALVSFVFNLGAGNFKTSTLRRKLNAGDYSGASAEFGRWVYSSGRKLGGLVKRRAEERALFDGE